MELSNVTRMQEQSRPSGAAASQQHSLGQVLDSWRAAERLLDDLPHTSPLRTTVRSEITRLRAEYQRLFARLAR